MATDEGITLSVNNEKEFQASLDAIKNGLKALRDELQQTISNLGDLNGAEDAAAKQTSTLQQAVQDAKQKVQQLSAEYDQQSDKLNSLRMELVAVGKANGTISQEAAAARESVNKQTNALLGLETQLSEARGELSQYETQLKEANEASGKMGDALKKINVSSIVGGVKTAVSAVKNLINSTEEYRTTMANLEVSSKNAGYSAEDTSAIYNQLYSVIGDNKEAATATANLQAMGLEQDKLQQITDGAIGAWATYGGSIPIDGLAEAINETIQTGKVTGDFADVLKKAGSSEDEFNAKLAAVKDPAERANMVLEEMASQGLTQAAEAWRQNNQGMIETNLAAASMDEAMAALAETLLPVVATITEAFSGLVGFVADLVSGFLGLAESGNVIVPVLAGVAAGVVALAAALQIKSTIDNVTEGFKLLHDVMKQNPILAVISIIAALVAAFITAYNTSEEFRAKVDAVFTAVQTVISTVVDTVVGVIKWFAETIRMARDTVSEKFASIEETIRSVFDKISEKIEKVWEEIKEIPEKIINTGKDIVEGLWKGVKEKAAEIKEKFGGFVGALKDKFTGTDGFDTNSPSKFTEQVGQWVAEGLGVGLAKDKTAVKAAENLTSAVKSTFGGVATIGAETAAQIVTAEEAALKTAESLNDRMLEKMNALEAELEKEGITEATKTSLNQQLTALEQFQSGYESSLTEIQNAYEQAVDNIEQKQESLRQKLADYGELFTTVQNEAGPMIEISDLQAQIDAIEAYGQALEKVRARGINETLMTEIQGLDVDGATDYMNQLLAMTDEEYAYYMELWREKQATAQEIASEFYKENMKTLKDEMTGQLNSYYNEFESVGSNLMAGVAQGVQWGQSGVVNSIKAALEAAVEAAKEALDIHSPSGVFKKIGLNMANGLGLGWDQGLSKVAGRVDAGLNNLMAPAAMADQATNTGMMGAVEALINGMAGLDQGQPGGAIQLVINLDGRTIAQKIFDPLKEVERQRGVAFG